ncbi:MAG: hypothetical protein KF802_10400 [Bdellovibrionaceae bacterium]|nr:hypothetical protein [Pseudobdellovibrionaceae bacterium]MBX3033820.1 hypothetical protein [Pseudobdellovibrionaceae bacterium]
MKNQNNEDAGFAEREALPLSLRVKKGFRSGALYWIAAVGCLPIPLLHFILVPLFVILGTVQAWSYWTGESVLRRGQSLCPKCATAMAFDDVPEKWPVKLLCPACGFQLRLHERE